MSFAKLSFLAVSSLFVSLLAHADMVTANYLVVNLEMNGPKPKSVTLISLGQNPKMSTVLLSCPKELPQVARVRCETRLNQTAAEYVVNGLQQLKALPAQIGIVSESVCLDECIHVIMGIESEVAALSELSAKTVAR